MTQPMNLAPRPQRRALPLAIALACAGGAAPTLAAEATALPELTVTGEKIDRSVKETTTAVTVLQGDAVESGQVDSVYDLAERAPNVIAHPNGVPSIRGMDGAGNSGRYVFVSGSRPRVSTTIDGIAEPWTGARYLDAGLWDVEQVEVMRGPQSTTQGRNTIGGAVVLKTKDPTFDFEGAMRAGYENEDGKYQLAGMVSGPLSDEVALRVTAEGMRGNGFISYTDPAGGWPWDPSEFDRTSVRGKLLWKPRSTPLTAKLSISQRHDEGEYLNYVSDPNYFDYVLDGTRHNTRYQDTDNTTVSGDLEYRFSESWTGHLLLSHSDYDAGFEQAPRTMSLTLDEESHTLEARMVYDPQGGAVRGVVGLYRYDRDQTLDALGVFDGVDEVDTTALFGESTIRLSDPWDLILGGRVERENQYRDIIAWGSPVLLDEGETMFLPKVGLMYAWSPETTFGATVRKGYSPGGVGVQDSCSGNCVYVYDKEEVVAYELSSRSTFMGGRMTLNGNLFFNRYDGYQANATLGNVGLNGNLVITNVPESETYGAEVEATVLARPGLELFGSLGLLHSEVTESNHPAIAKGNELGMAPKVNAALGFNQSFGSGLFFGADVNHVGEYFTEATNEEARKAGNYTVANAHLGYEGDDYTVRAYVNNLFDEEVLLAYGATNRRTGAQAQAQVGSPRTIGVVAEYRF